MSAIEITLSRAMSLDGARGAAVVDYVSRTSLGTSGQPNGLHLNRAVHGDTDVMRAKLAALQLIGYAPERMEDIVVTLDTEYHVIRPLTRRAHEGLFLLLVLDRGSADLDAVRKELRCIETLL